MIDVFIGWMEMAGGAEMKGKNTQDTQYYNLRLSPAADLSVPYSENFISSGNTTEPKAGLLP